MTAPYDVLIIEDNGSKLQEIKNALPPGFHAPISNASIAAAYRTVTNRPFHLVILDMTFQVSNEGGAAVAKESLAGVEVLQYMARKRLKTPVIVATQHTTFHTPELPDIDSIAKLDALLGQLFPNNYFRTVHVDLAGEAWKQQLAEAALAAVQRD